MVLRVGGDFLTQPDARNPLEAILHLGPITRLPLPSRRGLPPQSTNPEEIIEILVKVPVAREPNHIRPVRSVFRWNLIDQRGWLAIDHDGVNGIKRGRCRKCFVQRSLRANLHLLVIVVFHSRRKFQTPIGCRSLTKQSQRREPCKGEYQCGRNVRNPAKVAGKAGSAPMATGVVGGLLHATGIPSRSLRPVSDFIRTPISGITPHGSHWCVSVHLSSPPQQHSFRHDPLAKAMGSPHLISTYRANSRSQTGTFMIRHNNPRRRGRGPCSKSCYRSQARAGPLKMWGHESLGVLKGFQYRP
jgi:hypothetical protein